MNAQAAPHVDVVVIGAGACGLTAALAAHDAGAHVLVLERDAFPSGSTALSSGFIPAAGTRWQAAANVVDSPAAMSADIMRKNHGEADADLVAAVAAMAGPALEWLTDRHGLRFVLVEGFLYPGHRVPRMHAVPERTGAALLQALAAACARTEVEIVTSAKVTQLLAQADGRVTGVAFARPDGTDETVDCGAIVLACSGFGGNAQLVRAHIPELADAPYFGHAGNQGDALRWGEALGAATGDLGAYQGHGCVAVPHGVLLTWALMMEGGIEVNARGERFANEHAGYSEQCLPVLAQQGGVAVAVFDERLHRIGMDFADYRTAWDAGAIRRVPDASALAAAFGMDSAGLVRTFADVGRYAAGVGSDPFGRDFSGQPALEPPYFAARVTGALFHTQGGLVVAASARVLRADGTQLPNLLAGGGAARGLSGAHVWGYLSGNGLLSAIALGRSAGGTAAELVLQAAR